MPRSESGHPLTRLFQIVTLLHFRGAGRLRQADIAAACGISDRQLRRDLKALKAASVPWDTNSKRGYCHMIAYCRLRKGLRNFSMDGILKATDTGERFAPIAGFSLKDHLKGASGPNIGEAVQIEIVFDKDTARYARRRNWEFQHELRDEPDGSLRMTGIVRGLKDIQRELLSWGRHVEVIEPLELRNSIAEEARAMAAVYEAVEGRGLGD